MLATWKITLITLLMLILHEDIYKFNAIAVISPITVWGNFHKGKKPSSPNFYEISKTVKSCRKERYWTAHVITLDLMIN